MNTNIQKTHGTLMSKHWSTPTFDPYDILQVPRNTNDLQLIKIAYRQKLQSVSKENRKLFDIAYETLVQLIQKRSSRLQAPAIPKVHGAHWNDATFRKDSLLHDEIDPNSFDAFCRQRQVPKQYTVDDVAPIIRDREIFRGRRYDPETFNVMFELSKKKSRPDENIPTMVQPFNNDIVSNASEVAEHNGLMLIKKPTHHNGGKYGDYKQFLTESENSQVVTMDDVSAEEITRWKLEMQKNCNELTQNELKNKLTEFKNVTLPQPKKQSYKEAEQSCLQQQLYKIEEDKVASAEYIQRHLHMYPEFTRQSYRNNQLDHTLCRN